MNPISLEKLNVRRRSLLESLNLRVFVILSLTSANFFQTIISKMFSNNFKQIATYPGRGALEPNVEPAELSRQRASFRA